MSDPFDHLVLIMTRLRGEGGCPWDREQTHVSLKPYLIEEAYEVLEAIESGEAIPLCEELGDLLFQILFHAQIAREKNLFDVEDVLKAVAEKMVRRHPHVFSQETNRLENTESEEKKPVLDRKAVLERWEAMKRKEPGNRARESVLAGVPRSLPSLLRAYQVQSRAARVGFDWKEIGSVFQKVEEEFGELQEAVHDDVPERIESELGDLLFTLVNYARFLKVNPEDAMRGAIERFTGRFQKIELDVKEKGVALESLSLDEMNDLWEKAKLEVK